MIFLAEYIYIEWEVSRGNPLKGKPHAKRNIRYSFDNKKYNTLNENYQQ